MNSEPKLSETAIAQRRVNRYDRMEWAGAFGDLGTLIPFVVAYIGVIHLDPLGVLFAFGMSMLVSGLYYRTPFPVQPMKAIGAVASIQAMQAAAITPGAVFVAATVSGLVWLVLGLTGLVARIAKFVPGTVVIGIVLGLGLGFMLQSIKMMESDWLVAIVGVSGTVLLMGNRKIPAMFVLLAFGAVVGGFEHPELLTRIANASISFKLPSLAAMDITWNQFFVGTVLLALPQIPLTLGNAIVAIKDENNRLFPDSPVTERGVAVSTGIMNILSGAVGGVPMCHGAGGMAGHMAFGAKTGGSVVILGFILLALALFFSNSVDVLFQLFPSAVLGVILFLTGIQLAASSNPIPSGRGERVITLVCAALCIWNVAAGFVVGVVLHQLNRRGWLKL